MELDPQKIAKLQNIFKNLPHIIVVYIYGSRAKGYAAKSSDLDIVVVVDDIEGIDYGKLYSQVCKIIEHIELDLRVATLTSDPIYLFEITGGKCIYQRSAKERVNFETQVLRNFYDGKHIRDIYNRYLKQSFGVS